LALDYLQKNRIRRWIKKVIAMGIFISHCYSYDSRSETCEVFLGYTKPAATSNKLRIIRIGNRAATS